MAVFCLLDDKFVINRPKPYPWRIFGSIDDIDFKLFHKQVGYNGADGGSHGCFMYLFKILTLEEERCVFKEELPTV